MDLQVSNPSPFFEDLRPAGECGCGTLSAWLYSTVLNAAKVHVRAR